MSYKISNNQKNFDIYVTDANKKWSTLNEFYNSDLGEKMVFANSSGTDVQKQELLGGLKNSNFTQGILQEDSNVFLSIMNQTFENIAGDNRALLEQMMQTSKPSAPQEAMLYFDYSGNKLKNGDFFKLNRTSNSIFRFNSMKLESPSGKYKLFVYDLNDDIVQLERTYIKKNFVKIKFLIDRKSENVISIEKLSQTLSSDTIAGIITNYMPPIKQEEEEEVDLDLNEDEVDLEGEGVLLGGSIVKRLDDFKKRFNPDFKYVGRSGIEHVYKMSF